MFRRLFVRALLLLCALSMLPFDAVARPAAARKLVVVSWTDIHFGNEKYAPEAWKTAYDTGMTMHPDVIVMTGDQMDNKCTQAEFLSRQETCLTELRTRLDRVKAPVMLVYGNNDFYSNYQTDPEVLKATTSAYARQLAKYTYLDDLGNGVSPATPGGMTWISLNTQIFSVLNHYAGRDAQADRTFKWLEAKLAALPAGRPVVLLTHIPPTYDLYDGKLSWRQEDMARLARVLAPFQGRVTILGAHYHRNEVHALEVGGKPIPVLVAGSISFKYGNFPNWRSMQWFLDARGRVERFEWVDHYPGHPTWELPWSVVQPYTMLPYQMLAKSLQNLDVYKKYFQNLDAHNVDWKKWAEKPGARQMLIEQIAPNLVTAPVPAR